jgi:glycogen synthase
LDWKAPVVVVGHSCVLSWWVAVHGTNAPAGWQRYAERVRGGLRAADIVIAPTAAMQSALQRHYGPIRNARVIPNGRWIQERCEAKESFVLTAGRLWDRAKNVEGIARVASAIPWPVRVAGECRSPDSGELQLTGVEWLGRLPEAELLAWMRRAAIYALPARYEPFGLSVLEAALSGCALVLGDIPSLREIWGDAAVYVRPDDSPNLTAALRSLIDCADRRSALAERARHRARALTAEKMTDTYCDAYRSLLSLAAV